MQANQDGYGICRKTLEEAMVVLRALGVNYRYNESDMTLTVGDKIYHLNLLLGGEEPIVYVSEVISHVVKKGQKED